jgi:F0F1-type ATP synthase assembly protein I
MRYAGLGVQLAVSLLVFVLAGQWVDRKLGTGGIVTIVAAFLGFGGTMYALIRSLNRKDGGDE